MPGMPDDSRGEVEAKLGTGLEVSEESLSPQPPCGLRRTEVKQPPLT